jgi:hypothetical protein
MYMFSVRYAYVKNTVSYPYHGESLYVTNLRTSFVNLDM